MKFLVFLVALPLAAHDLFLMPSEFRVSPGQRITVAVHTGDGFPAGEEAPTIARLRDASLYARVGAYNLTNARLDGKVVLYDGTAKGEGTQIMAIRTIPNRIELPPDQFDAYLKEEGLNWVADRRAQLGDGSKPGRERYTKHAKSIVESLRTSDVQLRAVGHLLEFVPMARPEGTFPVQLQLRGKPAVGVRVELTHETGEKTIVGRTNGEGLLDVIAEKPGRYRLHCVVMEQRQEADVDWESFWASLTFQVDAR
jgi:uncharacterized GH25 family protein